MMAKEIQVGTRMSTVLHGVIAKAAKRNGVGVSTQIRRTLEHVYGGDEFYIPQPPSHEEPTRKGKAH